MIVTLRTLTGKSIIGFGKFKHTRVEDLLKMKHYKELISMYYNLERVTFSEDILKQLYLDDPEFAIPKPGKSKQHYDDFADMLVTNLKVHNNVNETFYKKPIGVMKVKERNTVIGIAKDCSRMLNKVRIQRGH